MIPYNWSTPYDKIFDFTTYDFGIFTPLENETWDQIMARLPKSYSMLDKDICKTFLAQIGIPEKSKQIIDREYQKISIRR